MSDPKPAARIDDTHNCKKRGHDGGHIVEGSPNVMIENKPAARVGDKAKCKQGGDNLLTQGSATVFINDKPAVRQDDVLDHGGKITSGASTVFIGSGGGKVIFGNKGKISIGGNGNPVYIGGQQIGSTATKTETTCMAAWDAIQQETDAIANISDPIERNKKISAAYAKVYQKNPKVFWSGTAAFASKQVGCGLIKVKNLDISGKVFSAVGEGNRDVFVDIYPVLKFYNQYGLARLKSCINESLGSVDQKVISALEKIDEGNLQQGNAIILQHEQKDVLSKMYNKKAMHMAVYVNHMFNQMGKDPSSIAYKLKASYTQPEKVSFTAACEGGEEVNFGGDDLANLNERLPYAQNVADTFYKLSIENPKELSEHLTSIIKQGEI